MASRGIYLETCSFYIWDPVVIRMNLHNADTTTPDISYILNILSYLHNDQCLGGARELEKATGR